MALSAGTRLGPYEVAEAIGAGGMGEVYRATDTKLGREAAIKALPSALAADTDRLARFDREAKLLAALNHPNIAVIYGLEEQDGTQCIAMELIEGETLEEKLKDGPLSVEDALPLALQIAQALEAAHEKGVVHRDLKPANVMITGKGQVKVLDFGLAKTFSEDANEAGLGQSPALSLAMTQAGMILGTAGYMSPEQASGQATDQRADVWGFGVVLFEMLSGLPLFVGESVPHILADILKTEPDWNKLPKNLHPRLKLLLERCLAKKPRSRYHAIADARIDIEAVLSDPEGVAAQSDAFAAASGQTVLPWAAASVAVTAAAAGLLAWGVWPADEPEPVNRFDYDLPQGQVFRNTGRRVAALSPDGRHFVYNTTDGLYLRTMGELEARLIPFTDIPLTTPTFSPDGLSVAFWAGPLAQLWRISVSGGAPVLIADVPVNPMGMSWADDGTFLYGQPDGIYRVAATGGTPELVISVDEGLGMSSPQLLPDGDSVLFTEAAAIASWDSGRIVAGSLSTGERVVLVEGGRDARYLPTGHLVYGIGNGLFARVFDAETLTVSGGAVPLLQSVSAVTGANSADMNFSVSSDGTLIYVVGTSPVPERSLVWVDRDGRETPLAAPPRAYTYPRLSPDGTKLALDVRDLELDIWVWDFSRETLTRLTFSGEQDEFPAWSPDGLRVALNSAGGTAGTVGGSRLSWRAADGTGQQELIAESDRQLYPASFLPDGTGILVRTNPNGNDDIAIAQLENGGEVVPLLETEFEELNPEISPDGRWLAYTSNESGEFEIYVRPYPDIDAGRWQVSNGGGVKPAWSRDGQELFFRTGNALMAVSIQTEPAFLAGNSEVVFEGRYFDGAGGRTYDVADNGERFLMIKETADVAATAQIIIVQNWLDEVERLAPTGN